MRERTADPADCVACGDVPAWVPRVLVAAGVYNLLWGAAVVLLPGWTLGLLGLDGGDGSLAMLWSCIGMIVGVYGVGYLAAARDPVRHWPIVLVGLLGKVFGPIGFVVSVAKGAAPLSLGWTLVFNDLIWWVPFAGILWLAFRRATGSDEPLVAEGPNALAARFEAAVTSTGETVGGLSREGAGVLLVCVRHLGCTFCRRTLADLAAAGLAWRGAGMTPVVVHLSEPSRGEAVLVAYGLEGVAHVSDPEASVYRALGLGRGTFGQLFGLRVFAASIGAVRHGVGRMEGDGLQMPGAFVVRDGRLVAAHRASHAGDLPDFESLIADAAGAPWVEED